MNHSIRQFDHMLVCSPSGAISEDDRLDRGISALRAYPMPLVEQPQVRLRHQRFAGTDAQRLQALGMAFGLPQSSLIVCTRGGYGLTRLLPHMPLAQWAQQANHYGHLLCGHSDVTVLQLALLKAGAQPHTLLHGPMVCFDFGDPAGVHPVTQQYFEQAAFEHRVDVSWHAQPLHWPVLDETPPHAQVVTGPVWGGNLTMITSLLGTPWQPVVPNGILVVEDINEPLYRVERMLLQLLHSGVLAQQKALVLGDWGNLKPNPQDQGFDLAAIVAQLSKALNIPMLAGFPFGHCTPKCAWFQGGQGSLMLQHNGEGPIVARLQQELPPI